MSRRKGTVLIIDDEEEIRESIELLLTSEGLSTDTAGNGEERSEEHTSELQSQSNLVCRLLLEKKKKTRLLTQRIQQYFHTSSVCSHRNAYLRDSQPLRPCRAVDSTADSNSDRPHRHTQHRSAV